MQDLKDLGHFPLLSQTIRRRVDQKWSSQGSNQHPNGRLVPASGGLGSGATASAQSDRFINNHVARKEAVSGIKVIKTRSGEDQRKPT